MCTQSLPIGCNCVLNSLGAIYNRNIKKIKNKKTAGKIPDGSNVFKP